MRAGGLMKDADTGPEDRRGEALLRGLSRSRAVPNQSVGPPIWPLKQERHEGPGISVQGPRRALFRGAGTPCHRKRMEKSRSLPYVATFFVFSDYIKPAMRLSA